MCPDSRPAPSTRPTTLPPPRTTRQQVPACGVTTQISVLLSAATHRHPVPVLARELQPALGVEEPGEAVQHARLEVAVQTLAVAVHDLGPPLQLAVTVLA